MSELQKVDRDLLAGLIRDGRMSLTDLAEQVGLSVSAVHQRVRRLEKQGLIAG
ncbi:MAG: winged helix-turn-helix transcriptional regulator, partial [Geodermatophilaceae bacterium]|nr:winged helix-turn-helix transcriptional regulator [Geodermatophilaceae bacterium]